MSHKETVCVHVAASNHDANLLAIFLNDAGIPAYAVEDRSDVGLHTFGALPGIHRPMVYVNRSQESEAQALIARYESKDRPDHESADQMFCYFCGAECDYETIDCPGCGRYLELGDATASEAAAIDDELPNETSEIGWMQDLKKPVAAILLFLPSMYVLIAGILLITAVTKFMMRLLQN